MTTGRINQVTTRQTVAKVIAPSRELSLGLSSSSVSVTPRPQRRDHFPPFGVLESQAIDDQSTLFPRSHKVQARFSLSPTRQRSRPSVRTTSGRPHLKDEAQSRRIPEWLIDQTGLAIGK